MRAQIACFSPLPLAAASTSAPSVALPRLYTHKPCLLPGRCTAMLGSAARSLTVLEFGRALAVLRTYAFLVAGLVGRTWLATNGAQQRTE